MTDLPNAIATRLKKLHQRLKSVREDSDCTPDDLRKARGLFMSALEDSYETGALTLTTEADAAVAAALERAAHIMPRYFAVYSPTGVHIGVWEDGFTAQQVLSEYPGGRIIETVEVAAIRALITQPQSGALAAVRAEARREAGRIAGLAVANIEIGFHDGISGDWRPMDGPSILSAACAAIRAALADAEGGRE